PWAGVEPETAREARRFIFARLPCVVPLLLGFAVRGYLSAMGVGARPLLISVAAGNAVNLVANYVLIYGDLGLGWLGLPAVGLPSLGVVGSGLATTLGTFTSLFVLLRAVPPPEPVSASQGKPFDGPAATRAMVRLGLPIGLQLFAEVGVFGIASV